MPQGRPRNQEGAWVLLADEWLWQQRFLPRFGSLDAPADVGLLAGVQATTSCSIVMTPFGGIQAEWIEVDPAVLSAVEWSKDGQELPAGTPRAHCDQFGGFRADRCWQLVKRLTEAQAEASERGNMRLFPLDFARGGGVGAELYLRPWREAAYTRSVVDRCGWPV